MSYDYLPVIKPFALQAFDPFNPPPTRWQIDAFRFVRSLLRLLDNPDAIAQACFGVCGQAAFLRAWAYRDPVAVANFALALYANGSARIGDYPIKASDEHLQSKWMKIPLVPDPTVYQSGAWGVGNRITECVWMICGALAATEAGSFEHCTLGHNIPPISTGSFDGQPASNLATLTLPGELQRWLEKTNCYPGGVEDRTSTIGGKELADDSFVTSDFDNDVDVFLCINHNLFEHAVFNPTRAAITPVGAPLNWFPDHWVMLKSRITVSAGTVSMNIWTWGGNYAVDVALADFNSNYYGSVVAHASASRRSPWPWPMSNAIGAPRIYYSQDNQLHFEWLRSNVSVEWCELNRVRTDMVPTPVGGGVMQDRNNLQRIWVADGSGTFKVAMPMPDPADPHGPQYEIAACRGPLRPNSCDPSSYNFYDEVLCNRLAGGYEYSAPRHPLCETQTTHFRLRYYGYPCSKQIPDVLDPYITFTPARSDQAIQFAGETIGHCRHDGSTEIVWNGASITVGSEARTPLSIQKLTVWFEYLFRLLGAGPYSLACLKNDPLIEVTVGDGFNVKVGVSPLLQIGVNLPALDEELPALCLQALLALEKARVGSLPEWVFPAFVSRVAVIQPPGTATAPVAFANFGTTYKACEAVTVYQAGWKAEDDSRSLQVDVRKPINPLLPAYLFVEFAGKPMLDASLQLSLRGQTPDGKHTILPVALQPSADRQYYWSIVQPVNTWTADYTLNLAIQGARAWSAPVLQALLGDSLDSSPGTVAALDTGTAGRLAFTGCEVGEDVNHRIEVGPQSRYARVATLTPDALESNNSFASATAVTSLILPDMPHNFGTTATVEKIFNRLNFHDQQDTDYFDVSYQCPAYDDSDAANEPAGGSGWSYLGTSFVHRPPQLSCQVTPDDFHCVDVAAYKYDPSAPVAFASETKSMGLTIASPSRALGAKRCYFRISNSSYKLSGAFFYAVRFAYTSAYDEVSVDGHAPAFHGNTTIKRKLLKILYERIDDPRPPEEGFDIIRIRDPAAFIKGYEQFLREPETAALLGLLGQRRNGALVVAEGMRALGQLAQAFHHIEEARTLFRDSADLSMALNHRPGALTALESLAALYKKLGSGSDYRKVLRQIKLLKM